LGVAVIVIVLLGARQEATRQKEVMCPAMQAATNWQDFHPSGYIPSKAKAYKSQLRRAAEYAFGLEAPVALFAGQIHQESHWNEKAQSPYAGGLAQFTPDTADWIADIYPQELEGQAAPYSPKWAIKALVLYDKYLLEKIEARTGRCLPRCDHWAMALAAYNGGLSWIKKDRDMAARDGANPDRWWNQVERYTSRSTAAKKENRDYPHRILLNHQWLYAKNGWHGTLPCPPAP